MNFKKDTAFTLTLFSLVILMLFPVVSFGEDDTGENISPDLEAISSPLMPGEALPEADIPEAEIFKPEMPETAVKDKEMNLLDLIKKGGIVGYLIILLSVVSVGLIIDYSFTVRKSKIAPQKDIMKLQELIKNRDFKGIHKLDNNRASFLSKVAISGLKESHLGYQSMIKAMEDAGEALASGIARKIEHLNVIGNISPMLGLLGTVIGMLRCFNKIANMTGAIDPKQLAGGIFEALVTTCLGLIVAIPALYCYAVFRNRVDEYTGEASVAAEHLISPFKSEAKG